MKKTIIFSLLLAFFGLSQADELILKNGDLLTGKLIRSGSKSLEFQVANEKARSFALGQVREIRLGVKDEKTKAVIPLASTQASPSVSPLAPSMPSVDDKATSKSAPSFLGQFETKGPFATPIDTFNTWKEAAISGNQQEMVKCYASFRQKAVRKELKKLGRKKRKAMQETTAQTRFTPKKPLYEAQRASLEVNWEFALHRDTQILQFVLEQGMWKLVK